MVNMDTRPGKRLQKNDGKIHHAINGKSHYFDWAIFNSYVKLREGIWYLNPDLLFYSNLYSRKYGYLNPDLVDN